MALAWAWTAIVGTPLVVVIYPRYWYGLLRARLGRSDVLDRVLEANALPRRLGRAGICGPASCWRSLGIRSARSRAGAGRLVDASHVVCANHASLLDILALIRVVPPPFRFVAKRELTRWPIVGWALAARPGRSSSIAPITPRRVRSIAEAAVRKIRGQVIFFVEGTRTRTGQLQPFKKGAFHFAIDNRLPVLPTAVRGSFAVLAKLPWWKLHSGRAIEIRFCPPIEPTVTSCPAEVDSRVEALRFETREAIAAALAA